MGKTIDEYALRTLAQKYAEGSLSYADYRVRRRELLDALVGESEILSDTLWLRSILASARSVFTSMRPACSTAPPVSSANLSEVRLPPCVPWYHTKTIFVALLVALVFFGGMVFYSFPSLRKNPAPIFVTPPPMPPVGVSTVVPAEYLPPQSPHPAADAPRTAVASPVAITPATTTVKPVPPTPHALHLPRASHAPKVATHPPAKPTSSPRESKNE